MSDPIEIKVPDIGDFQDVEIIEVHVSAGEEVAVEDPLITLETDKATMDVPAERAGTIVSIDVSVGDRVSQGDPLVTIEASADDAESEAEADSPAQGGAPKPVLEVHDGARGSTRDGDRGRRRRPATRLPRGS